jgi:hypothetical protein
MRMTIIGEHPTAGAHYEDEHVVLDGKAWLNCTFKNCTLSASESVVFQGCIVTGEAKMDNQTYRFIFGCDIPAEGSVSIMS